MNQTYVMYKWKGNDMNFHGDYAVSYVEHQDHLFKICRSHTLELLQSNSDLQIRQAVELKLGLGATHYQWTDNTDKQAYTDTCLFSLQLRPGVHTSVIICIDLCMITLGWQTTFHHKSTISWVRVNFLYPISR